jgi:anti-sigma B factor antagonist
MNIRIETIGQTTVVIPEGRLDFGTTPNFEKELERALVSITAAPAALIIDCTGLDYVSSAGLRAFLITARSSRRAGIRLALCALKPAVREVFDLTGFSRIIAVHADRATALAHAQPG